MNIFNSRPLARCALLVCLVMMQAGAYAYDAPIPVYAYPGDHVAVPLRGGGQCNAAQLDPTQAPTIRMTEHHVMGLGSDSYRYEVRYALRNIPDAICGTPPGPPTYYVDIGALPVGYHYFDIEGTVDGVRHAAYSPHHTLVRVHDRPADDISGVWYAPEQSGRGFTTIRSDATFVLYWATHDGDGQPTWATLITSENQDGDSNQNTFGGEAITTSGAPLAPGAAALETERWARVRFTYRGCGRATFEWGALDPPLGQQPTPDPQIGEGSLELVQVLTPDSVAPCDAVKLSGGRVAEWIATP